MSEPLNIGTEKLPSVLKDPFKKNKVSKISVTFEEPYWSSDKEWKTNGWVYFKNGDTKGEQAFKAEGSDSFNDVV